MLRMPFTLNAPSRGVPLGENETAMGDLTRWPKQRQVGVIAAVERQFHDGLRVDHLAVLAGIGFESGGRAGYRHRFGHRRQPAVDVYALAGVHVYDVVGSGNFEIRRHLRNGVSAHFDVEEIIVAVFFSCGLGLDSGVLVGERDGRFGYSQAELGSCTVPSTSPASNCANSAVGTNRHSTRTKWEKRFMSNLSRDGTSRMFRDRYTPMTGSCQSPPRKQTRIQIAQSAESLITWRTRAPI